MADDITFVVHKEWVESIKSLPVDQQDKILAEIVRYGTDSKMEHEDDPLVQTLVNVHKNRIDFSKNKYNQKVEAGKSAGRKKKIDDSIVLSMAQEGKSSSEIAEILGVAKSTVDHSEGWRNRNKPIDNNEFEF